MKTFLYSIPNRIQSFSKKLDVKAALCGKSWEVFNDEGVKQLFIFNEDGTILITNNGKVINASWKFIPANSSILITTGDETIMFRPAFFNKDVFALQQDGIERYLFMIDEERKPSFRDLSLDSLAAYIEKEIEALPNPALIEQQREEERQELLRKTEEEKKRLIQYMKEHKDEIDCKLDEKKRIGRVGITVSIIILISPLLFIKSVPVLCLISIVALFVALFFLNMLITGPNEVLGGEFKKGARYHNDEEVRKIYEGL